MKTTLLLPYRCKQIGWMVFIPALFCGLLALATDDHLLGWRMKVLSAFGDNLPGSGYFQVITTDITYTLAGSLVIIGGLLIAFSREKQEDEFVAQLRLASFQWAVLANYGLLLAAFLMVYGIPFLMVLPYHMFTVILLFIARFEYLLYRNRKMAFDEEHA